jgi:MoaA/NifB/PqqE/SkfB family radical SAM enzyme
MRRLIKLYIIIKYALPWRKPLYLFRLLYQYVKYLLSGQAPLRGIDFSIGLACNLKCKHCFNTSFDWDRNRPMMEMEDYRRVVKEAMGLGCITFALQGGEPLLYPELEKIVKALRPRLNRVPISTNGILLTREKLISLKHAGVDTINISLDSGDPEEHDRFRGMTGAYHKAMKSLEEAISMGFATSINMTISRKTLYSEGFIKLLEFSHKKRIMINTLFAAPAGNWKNSQKFLLQPEDIEYYNTLKERYPFMTRDIERNYGPDGCAAVREVFYITCYGDVLACPFIHISLGNVLEEPLAKIRERGLQTALFNKYHFKCWIGEDQDYMKSYIELMGEKEMLPISWNSPEGKALLFDYSSSSPRKEEC